MDAMSECIECGKTFEQRDDESGPNLTNRVIDHLKAEHSYFA